MYLPPFRFLWCVFLRMPFLLSSLQLLRSVSQEHHFLTLPNFQEWLIISYPFNKYTSGHERRGYSYVNEENTHISRRVMLLFKLDCPQSRQTNGLPQRKFTTACLRNDGGVWNKNITDYSLWRPTLYSYHHFSNLIVYQMKS